MNMLTSLVVITWVLLSKHQTLHLKYIYIFLYVHDISKKEGRIFSSVINMASSCQINYWRSRVITHLLLRLSIQLYLLLICLILALRHVGLSQGQDRCDFCPQGAGTSNIREGIREPSINILKNAHPSNSPPSNRAREIIQRPERRSMCK